MARQIIYVVSGALLGEIGIYVLAEGLPEGAIMGGILGGSIGMLIAVRRQYGASGPAFEYEAAGIHDDNLITTARRNLVREAYRDSFAGNIVHAETEQVAQARQPKRN